MGLLRKKDFLRYRVRGRGGRKGVAVLWHRPKLLALLVLAAIIVVVVRMVSAPVEGHITDVDITLPKKSTTQKQTVAPASSVKNVYYTLNLPVGYHVQAASQNVPGILLNQMVTKPGSFGSLIINIAVKTVPAGGLGEDSSYRLRLQDTGRYTTSAQTYDGESVKVSNDSQSADVSAFWQHGGYLATIGISSSLDNPAADDNVEELATLKTLLDGWDWQ